MPPAEQRWVVDAVAEEVARVEVDGERMLSVPAWLLPAGTREGDVLRATRERGRGRSVVTIEREPAAARRPAGRDRPSEPGGDATGDIVL